MAEAPPPPARIVKKIDTGHIVKLGEENYDTWSFQVAVVLKAQGIWDITSGATACPPGPDASPAVKQWRETDLQGQAVICTLLNDKQLTHIADLNSSKAMWDKLKLVHSDASAYNRQLTQSKFFAYKIKDEQSIVEAYGEIETLARKMKTMNIGLEDCTIIAKIVSALPEKYIGFKKAWDSVPDADQTMPRLLARLKKEELEMKNSSSEPKEETATAIAFSTKKNAPNKTPKKKGECFSCGKIGHYANECRSKKPKKGNCYNCNKPGHHAKDCRKPKQNSHQQQQQQTGDKLPEVFMAFMAGENEQLDPRLSWWADTGASHHYCGNMDWYKSYQAFDHPVNVTLTDNRTVQAVGKGSVLVYARVSRENAYIPTIIEDVHHIPGGVNLFSIGTALDKGYILGGNAKGLILKKGNNIAALAHRRNGSFIMDFKLGQDVNPIMKQEMQPQAFVSQSNSNSIQLWHQRLGHINETYLKNTFLKRATTGVDDVQLEHQTLTHCSACHLGKDHKQHFPTATDKHYQPGEYLHADLMGKISPPSLGGHNYVLLVVDEATNFRVLAFISEKSQTNEKLKEFIIGFETQTGNKVKHVRTDNGTEFVNKEMKSYYSQKGILHDTTAPYTSQMNGKAERNIRTLKDMTTTLMLAEIPRNLWAEAMAFAVYILNRTLNSINTEKTAYELIHKNKPSLALIKTFGSKAYLLIPKEMRKEFGPKAKELILVGMQSDMAKYRLYDPVTKKVYHGRNVSFNEPAPEGSMSLNGNDELVDTKMEIDKEETPPPSPAPTELLGKEAPSQAEEPTQGEDIPARVLRDRSKLQQPERYRAYYSVLEPQSYQEAVNCPEYENWNEAINDEYKSLIDNNTWELVPREEWMRPLAPKWLFKIKEHAETNEVRYKARLVVRGFQQREGIDYTETFSSVITYESVRLLLNLATFKRWYIRQFDVKCAFLNGELEEEIYMLQPEGFNNQKNEVCRLKKALYGLKQAPRQWQHTLTKVLGELGFFPSEHDPCVYIHTTNELIIGDYVDDGLIMGANLQQIEETLKKLNTYFEVKSALLGHTYIGMRIIQGENRDWIMLSQQHYIEKLVEKYSLTEATPTTVPMQVNLQLEKQDPADERYPYRELIGALLFIARVSRPDIMYSVNKLAQYNNAYGQSHFKAAIQILRYLKGSSQLYLEIQPKDPLPILYGFSDADYAANVDRKSTSGSMFFLGGSPITWNSCKQRIIAVSSTESEYIALADTSKECMWIRSFLEELKCKQLEPTTIYVDNQSTIHLANNPVVHKRSKHIDVRYHKIREYIEEDAIKLEHVHTSEQRADIFTKALPPLKFSSMRGKLGLIWLTITCLIACAHAVHFTEESPILWKRLETPVANGIEKVFIKIKLKSPCSFITPDKIHEELMDHALSECEQMFRDRILLPMKNFCPTPTPRGLHVRNKRVVPVALIVGVIAIASLVQVGIGVTSVVALSQATENGHKLEILKHNSNATVERLNEFVMKYDDLIDKIQQLGDDLDQMKIKSVSSTYTLSYLTTQMVTGQTLIQQSANDWKKRQVNEQLLSFWNISLPCGTRCPVDMAIPRECKYTSETDTWYMSFETPLVNEFQTLVAADPFILMLKSNNKTCSVKYKGAPYALMDTSSPQLCVQRLPQTQAITDKWILYLGQVCEKERLSNYWQRSGGFKTDGCMTSRSEDNQDFIQIKYQKDLTYIYCPENKLEIHGQNFTCPDHVFSLPSSTSFAINGVKYKGAELHLTLKGQLDAPPVNIGWALSPRLNLSSLKVETLELQTIDDSWTEQHFHWPSMLYIVGLTVLLWSLWFLYRRYGCRIKNRSKQTEKVVRLHTKAPIHDEGHDQGHTTLRRPKKEPIYSTIEESALE